ncbi:MAG: helix-turn-helix transcriptional regulator [Pseudomonadota bacterium]
MSQTVLSLSPRVPQLEARPQPVVVYARNLRAGDVLPSHQHARAQMVYARTGVMTVTTPGVSHLVPPQRAVWVPGGVAHEIEARSSVEMRTLYVQPDAAAALPADVQVFHVSALLRELILAAVAGGSDYAPDTPQARLATVLLDQIGAQQVASLSLPMPREPRMLKIVHALIAAPGDPRDLSDWARDVGASKRTLTRLFRGETGLTFRDWRQRLRVMRALEMLAAGDSVTATAMALGYDSTSAFIVMFRRTLGATPRSYLSRS